MPRKTQQPADLWKFNDDLEYYHVKAGAEGGGWEVLDLFTDEDVETCRTLKQAKDVETCRTLKQAKDVASEYELNDQHPGWGR